jgi:hypothetical protein
LSNGPSSSGIGLGDLTLQAQYRLTKFHVGSWIPTTSLAVQETLPTGKYDRLGNRPSDGLGSGAYATTLALCSQMYFWLPNGRILRQILWELMTRSGGNRVRRADPERLSRLSQPATWMSVTSASMFQIFRKLPADLFFVFQHVREKLLPRNRAL